MDKVHEAFVRIYRNGELILSVDLYAALALMGKRIMPLRYRFAIVCSAGASFLIGCSCFLVFGVVV